MFETSGVERRFIGAPLDWFASAPGFAERNALWTETARALAKTAAEKVLEATATPPDCIDQLLFVSTTGLATPSLDAHLVGELGCRPGVARAPIFGLGCAGGALGLLHAAQLLRGAPGQRLLLVNVELCSLTFVPQDYSPANLVATALFGDAVTATLVVGGETDLAGLEIVAGAQWLWPDTLDVMGWSFLDHGMQVVFSRRIPRLVREEMAPCMERFLEAHELRLHDITHLLVHPGGPKVLAAYQDALGLEPERLALARSVLADYGNCSAATVMLVLERFLAQPRSRAGDLCWLSALGPGFSCGQLFLRC